MIILSADPGEKNYAYSVTEISGKGVKLYETGMVTETIINLTSEARVVTKSTKVVEPNLTDSLHRFKKKIEQLHRKYKINHFCAERFQTRGVKGRSTETVSMMNAVASFISVGKKATIRLIVASQWKNHINKIVPLEELYEIGQKRNLTNHTVDTICMAIYEYVTYFGKTDLDITPVKLKNIIRTAQKYKVT